MSRPGIGTLTSGSRVVWILLLLLAVFVSDVTAQDTGSLAGLVVSTWDGAALPGVTVTVRGTTLAAQSDVQGRYLLKGVPSGDQVLRFSKSGFAAVVVPDARVLPGQTTTVNGNLRPEFYEMEEYEVTAEEFTEQTEKIQIERQKSSAMMEALGSDFLSRVGAANAAESISKVAGATIVEGKSAVVRGLNDRYITTTLNGASIPSADPYRQSASLDLFPSQVIDQVVVAKTFTPDQPGTYTGGGIDIITKSFPEKPFVSLVLGTSYNPQANLNDRFLTYDGGGLDWAGTDDGTRALPPGVAAQAPIHPPPPGALPSPLVGNVASNNPARPGQYTLDSVSRELGVAEFASHRETSPLNQSFSAAGGGSGRVFEGKWGYFAGVSYRHDYSFYEDGIARRYQQGTQLKSDYRDARALSVVNWSGMVNLAYQPVENHELGFTFFYNQNGTDDTRIQDGGFENSDPSAVFRKFNLYFTERNLNTYQLKGEHRIPEAADLKFDWLVALTGTSQDEPGARFFNDYTRGAGYNTGNPAPSPSDPTRYYRTLEEDNQNAKLDWTLPLPSWTAKEGALRFGLFDSLSGRSFSDRGFYYPGGGSYQSDPNLFLDPATLGAHPTTNAQGRVNFHWGKYVQVFDSLYDCTRDIPATYLMLEVPIVDRLRIVGGARCEATDLEVRSESYVQSSITGKFANSARINQTDWLPAVGLIYEVRSNMNVRLNYSQTVARPSFRELASYYAYDPLIDEYVQGNPQLAMSSIENYDLRWEWFRKSGEMLSVSLFYKELRDAIERGDLTTYGDVITYLNRGKAQLFGIELEARKSLGDWAGSLSPFSVGGNFSYVMSEVELTAEELFAVRSFLPGASSTRPLYDQSPYIINVDLTYSRPRSGTSVALVFNITGPRIALTKLNTEDVYEQAAPALDLVVSQKLGKHLTAKFAAKNLLDPEFERTYGKDSALIYSSYSKGRAFGLSFNYDF